MLKFTTGISPEIEKCFPGAKAFGIDLALTSTFDISPTVDKAYPDKRRPAPAINLISFSVEPTDYGRQNRFNRTYEPYRPLDLASIAKISQGVAALYRARPTNDNGIRLERLFGVTPEIDRRYPAPKAA